MTGRQWNTPGLLLLYCIFNLADDTALLFETKSKLMQHGFALIRLLKDFGLEVHLSTATDEAPKTAAMCVQTKTVLKNLARFARNHPPPPPPNGDVIEIMPFDATRYIPVVSDYVYIGTNISDDLKDDNEVKRRLKSGNACIGLLRKRVLGPHSTSATVKKAVYEGMILGILLYGSENWILSSSTEKLLNSFHHRALRTMSCITLWHTRKYGITTIDLQNRLQLHSMRHYLDKRILGWAGHVSRMPTSRWPKQLLTSYVQNPRPIEAPLKTYGRALRQALHRKKIPFPSWQRTADNRAIWRKLINAPTETPRSKSDFTGRTIVLPNYDEGTVVRKIASDDGATWQVKMDNGIFPSLQYFNTRALQKMALPHGDLLNWAKRTVSNPASLLRRAVRKKYGNDWHLGTITNHDTDKANGNVLWEITYQDGDISDYALPNLAPLLLPLKV